MRGIRDIFNKEMRKVFKEPKMIVSLFILPVVLMIAIYGLIGMLSENKVNDVEAHISVVYMANMPEGLTDSMTPFSENAKIHNIGDTEDLESLKQQIARGEADLLVIFPKDFMASVNNYLNGNVIPDVTVYYNPSEEYSQEAWTRFNRVLDEIIRPGLLKERIGDLEKLTVFTINETAENAGQVYIEQKAASKVLSQMLPYLITMLLFAGTMSLGNDVITGEKERGTMASMLVTPVKRRNIVLGKILALTTMSIMSAVVYIVALVVAVPKAFGAGDMKVTFSVEQIIMIGILMIVLAFFYVSVIGIVAVLAKTMKEAATYTSPLYILVIVAGLITMLSPTKEHAVWQYMIPVYGNALSIGQILTQELTVTNFGINVAVTLLIGLVACSVIAKCFDSERIMFNA